MGKRGPAPKPTALRLIEGNRGHQKINKEQPRPRPVTPPCPSWLSSLGKREWRRVVPELESMGLLTIVDMAALAGYCESYAVWKGARRQLKTEAWVYPNLQGTLCRHPLVGIADKALANMLRFASEFGFTPAARTRIQVPKAANDDDMSEFFD